MKYLVLNFVFTIYYRTSSVITVPTRLAMYTQDKKKRFTEIDVSMLSKMCTFESLINIEAETEMCAETPFNVA